MRVLGLEKAKIANSISLRMIIFPSFLRRPLSFPQSDYFENRKQAIKLAHGCHHEEVQVSNMPSVARAMIRGYSEAKSICVRYNTGIEYVQECGNETQIASAYMAKCVDAQYKQLACPTGEYAGTCAEGNTAGLADFKRVQALSARFRANQMSTIAKTQAKYDAKLFARSMFRTCNYEEDVCTLATMVFLVSYPFESVLPHYAATCARVVGLNCHLTCLFYVARGFTCVCVFFAAGAWFS